MTPGQARIALLSFLLVMTGVVINALFLQTSSATATRAASERPPARVPADRGRKAGEAAQSGRSGSRAAIVEAARIAGEHPLRIARFAPDAAQLDGPPQAAHEAASAETVGAIQRELTTRGYGPLSGDGSIDLATRAAIIAFEHDHGLALTGEASERLLQRILLGAAAGGDGGGGKVRSAQAEDIVRTVQRWLAALGYPVGRIDGRLGEDTVKAIRDFEMDKGLVPKGRVSADLVVRLREAAAKPSLR